VKELMGFAGKLAGDIVLNPVTYSCWGIIKMGYQIYNRFTANPFFEAYNEAKVAGIYLAELIIEHFSDRFINIVGFSLGTQVLLCCFDRLLEKGKVHLINRIITLGGVADKHEVEAVLQKCGTSINWLNLWSINDSTVRFLYRACSPRSTPIGASNIAEIEGHRIKS
jgi:hypothetical protein